jgi:dTMP kinase|tara:strand:+ start:2548 stop:3171 length:624 start_codon:yes stop_codon:yes gene_type:complete
LNLSGKFISFEGIDGCGKSTQAKILSEELIACGHKILLTREPGGSDGAEEIRNLLLTGNTDRWSAETEILLFTAARRDHLERTILPALENGLAVICDRFSDSTRVYQGVTRGDLRDLVDQLDSAMIPRQPDITVLIDLDPNISLARAIERSNNEARFEDFGVEMQIKLRKGFLSLAHEFPNRFMVIDGNRTEAEVAENISKRLHEIG